MVALRSKRETEANSRRKALGGWERRRSEQREREKASSSRRNPGYVCSRSTQPKFNLTRKLLSKRALVLLDCSVTIRTVFIFEHVCGHLHGEELFTARENTPTIIF